MQRYEDVVTQLVVRFARNRCTGWAIWSCVLLCVVEIEFFFVPWQFCRRIKRRSTPHARVTLQTSAAEAEERGWRQKAAGGGDGKSAVFSRADWLGIEE